MSLDFANPIGVAAAAAPEMRFVVFSDSSIITCPVDHAASFVSVLAFLTRQWGADGMLVRGGVAAGHVEWVDDWTDKPFRALPNLSLSRVFGLALLNAYETEQKSGAGAMIFLHNTAVEVLSSIDESFVVPTSPPILTCCDEDLAGRYPKVMEL